jgi:hypothetical protein
LLDSTSWQLVWFYAFLQYCKVFCVQGQAQRPEVRIVTWQNEELTRDALPIYGFEHYKAKDYVLAHAPFSGKLKLLQFGGMMSCMQKFGLIGSYLSAQAAALQEVNGKMEMSHYITLCHQKMWSLLGQGGILTTLNIYPRISLG